MKKLLGLLLAMTMLFTGFALAEDTATGLTQDIVVLFTSDVHCGVDSGFGYAGLAAVRDTLAKSNHVLLVDNGDSIQGEPIGTMTTGESNIQLMNAVGYDIATMGNHEFDYGMDRFLELAEKADIPVCASMMGLGGFPAGHRLWLGMVGMHGTLAANRAARECDLLLVCGARFSDRVAGSRNGFAPNAQVVHLDIDHAEFDKNVPAAVRVAGDLSDSLAALAARTAPADHTPWVDSITALRREPAAAPVDPDSIPDPLAILQTLRRLTPDDTIVATDVGQHQMWTAQHFPFTQPRTLLTSGGLGTMGYGLGAAIGAQCGMPERRVVLISGDGSFHMNLNELTTLASYELPVVVVVMNNQVLGMVRQWQKVFYENRFSSTDPHRKTDLVKLAEAFGCTGLRIARASDILPVLQAALDKRGPVVVDCRISPDANVLPMIPPGGTVEDMIESMDN